MDNNYTLSAKITELETKVAFQELIIEELNQALIEQQFAIDKLQTQIRHIAEKLKGSTKPSCFTSRRNTPSSLLMLLK